MKPVQILIRVIFLAYFFKKSGFRISLTLEGQNFESHLYRPGRPESYACRNTFKPVLVLETG